MIWISMMLACHSMARAFLRNDLDQDVAHGEIKKYSISFPKCFRLISGLMILYAVYHNACVVS